MAKNRNYTRHETGKSITTKSWFGSHQDMVVPESEIEGTDVDITNLKDGEVICRDDRGYYVTHSSRLDTGLADPSRYSFKRGEK